LIHLLRLRALLHSSRGKQRKSCTSTTFTEHAAAWLPLSSFGSSFGRSAPGIVSAFCCLQLFRQQEGRAKQQLFTSAV
jgi:hypothetical protein